MRNWPGKVDIQLPGCEALRALCFEDKGFEEMLVNYDVVPLLLHSLRTCVDVDTLKECLLLLTSLLNVQHVREFCTNQVLLSILLFGSERPFEKYMERSNTDHMEED